MNDRSQTGRFWVGIDIGGTFADYVLFDARSGSMRAFKSPAPRSTRAEAVLSGLRTALERHGVTASEVAFVGHGTTVATNTLISREAPPAAALTTRGFGDVLVIRRQTRRETFDYYSDFPPPLVARTDTAEVTERMDAYGEIVTPLDEGEVVAALKSFVTRGVKSIAICFMHSYVNPAHEQRVREIVEAQFPDLLVTLSSDLMPEFREYERMSTTALNAFVRPIVTSYLSRFEEGVREIGINAPFVVVQSNGGVVSCETAKRQPVSLLRSGPAAGVSGAAFIGRMADQDRLITLDIGGTSTDISVFDGGAPSVVRDWEVNTFPVKWTAIDVRSIGAGGGSLAWIDSGGLLKVGPESAGADPGPACYGKGGGMATVTDAHVVLGRIGPGAVLGDSLRIDAPRAQQVMEALAAKLGRSSEETAAGIIEITNAAIAQEIHFAGAEKGINLHDFTLVAYGGAGPLHAAHVAHELGIRKVLVPFWPGLLCALGVLTTEPKADFAMTRLLTLSGEDGTCADSIGGLFGELDRRCNAWLREQNIPSRATRRAWSLDMRYRGQNYELSVALPDSKVDAADVIEGFHRRHEQAYGYRSAKGVVQCVQARLAVALEVDHPPFKRRTMAGQAVVAKEHRRVYMGREHGFVACPVYERDAMPGDLTFNGPAIIEQMDTTTLVLPGQRGRVDDWGNIVLERDG